jgi:hypothetical protein
MEEIGINEKKYKLEEMTEEQRDMALRLNEIAKQKKGLRQTLSELNTLENAYVNTLKAQLEPEESKEESAGDQNGG